MKKITSENLIESDSGFNYQPDLTKFLDGFSDDFNNEILEKITLWKVNRFPLVSSSILEQLNDLKDVTLPDGESKVRDVLGLLLRCKGVQLPMASTYLRSRNPQTFQLIDQRVYRVIYGEELELPGNYSIKNHPAIIDIYLKYLQDLRVKCDELGVNFIDADRVFYTADKRLNKTSKIKNY